MKERKLRRNFQNEVNSSSMADIAFLLLIFFLVSTTIKEEQGILVKLPRFSEDEQTAQVTERNLCTILINHRNQILVRDKAMELESLTIFIKEFISNPNSKLHLATNPSKAVVCLQNDRGTNYASYIQVYNELKKAYTQLRDEKALVTYGIPFEACNSIQKQKIKHQIPMNISESEPSDYVLE